MATTAATLTITPVHPAFAAEVAGIDLTQRLDDVTFERIAVAFDDYSVLVFRGQALSDEQQTAFSERWGPLESTVRTVVSSGPQRSLKAICCSSLRAWPRKTSTE